MLDPALLASRRDREAVLMRDFENAKDKVMMGAERKSVVLTEEDRRLAAIHEAGHALVAKLMPGGQPINKATIIPRGQAMGMVSFLADERHSMSETRLRALLCTALGGYCAEGLVFGERTTGAQGDFKQVAALARSMVCEWGMNKDLGPLAFDSDDDAVFLGRDFSRRRGISEKTAQTIDEEVRAVVLESEEKTRALLQENEERLRALAEALMRHEVLDDAEIGRVLDGETLDPARMRLAGEKAEDEA